MYSSSKCDGWSWMDFWGGKLLRNLSPGLRNGRGVTPRSRGNPGLRSGRLLSMSVWRPCVTLLSHMWATRREERWQKQKCKHGGNRAKHCLRLLAWRQAPPSPRQRSPIRQTCVCSPSSELLHLLLSDKDSLCFPGQRQLAAPLISRNMFPQELLGRVRGHWASESYRKHAHTGQTCPGTYNLASKWVLSEETFITTLMLVQFN